MPRFDADAERITVFRVDDEYLFTHFFDRTDVFEELAEYYDDEAYRFEVPESAFDEVCDLLEEAYYDPVVVEDLEPYCVVTGRYDEYADVLRNSVLHWERRDHRFFLMKDELAVREAVEGGAERLENTEFVLGL